MAQLLVNVAQILLAIILAAIASYLGVVLFNRATRDLDEWAEIKKGNAAMGVVAGGIIVGIAIILRPAILVPPMADTALRLYPVYALLTQLAGMVLGLILAMCAILFAVILFDQLTGQVDELAELQRGNLAVAAMMVGVIIAISLLMGSAVDQLMLWFTNLLM